ncbi:hypothetical protein EON81_23600 [bacterium]|nr:MAG: hypothetical protein EON81_23600 [bacterium]
MSDRYDPQAVDDSPAKSEYFTRKDAKWLLLLIVVAVIAGYPLYKWGLEKRNKALCVGNIKALGEALNLYTESYDDRYPPLFESDAAGSPNVADGRTPVTWASFVYGQHNGRTSLVCPAAEENEASTTEWGGKPQPITYGLYAAHASVTRSTIDSPDDTILIAETTALGVLGSYDPLPYRDHAGQPVSDAYVIGWNNSNTAPNAQTKSVTRLAFRDTGNGTFGAESHSRHEGGIQAVTVSGRGLILTPSSSLTSWNVSTLRGQWRNQP